MSGHLPFGAQVILNGQYAERPAMPHEAETRPVTLGSRIRETAFLCRLRRHDLVALPVVVGVPWVPQNYFRLVTEK